MFSVECITESGDPSISGAVSLRFQRENTFGVQCDQVPYPPEEEFPGVRMIESHKEDRQTPLHRLLTKAIQEGTREQVIAVTAELIPGIKDIRILTEGNEPIVQLEYEDHSVPAALSGDGVYSLVRLSLELATRANGTVLLEEPEVHQHPGAIRQTIRAVLAAVRRDIQVVLTTHSLELIDALLAESSEDDIDKLSLYRLELDDGRLISVRTAGPEVAFSRGDIEKDLR